MSNCNLLKTAFLLLLAAEQELRKVWPKASVKQELSVLSRTYSCAGDTATSSKLAYIRDQIAQLGAGQREFEALLYACMDNLQQEPTSDILERIDTIIAWQGYISSSDKLKQGPNCLKRSKKKFRK